MENRLPRAGNWGRGRHKGIFWCAGNILSLDCSGGYITVHTLKFVELFSKKGNFYSS